VNNVYFLARTASRCRRAYILPLWFFLSFFSTPNLWGHWMGSQPKLDTYSLMTDDEKFGLNSLGIYPLWAGGKKCWTHFELWPNITLQWNMISTIGKKILNLQGLPYMPPNSVNFGPETAESGWRVFVHPLNFCIGKHCHMDIIQQTAGKLWHVLYSGTSLQYRTTECRAGSCWALPCI